MKLSHIITLRMTVLTTLVLLFWSGLFYFAIVNEINDEVDDSLDDYAEMIIIRFMRNEPLPSASNGSNNQFFLKEVTQEYAASVEHVRYEDRKIYIFAYRRTEYGIFFIPIRLVSDTLYINNRLIILFQFCINDMFTSRQMYNRRCSWWKP